MQISTATGLIQARHTGIADWRDPDYTIRGMSLREQATIAGMPVVSRQTPRPTLLGVDQTLGLLR